ncbi:MAG: DUF2007 domain-containing protein [Deltaproteobacteria bacterium]|jgi:hypothetical protein|nr:DUF2007 domain-containing protein [Deltaproteobacteria bacterium]
MKKLYTFGLHQRGLAALLRERLEKEGVSSLVRNEQLFTGLGEIPFVEIFPEIWILDDEMYPRAKMLIYRWLTDPSSSAPDWTCPRCGEELEGQFDCCWQCGHEKDN